MSGISAQPLVPGESPGSVVATQINNLIETDLPAILARLKNLESQTAPFGSPPASGMPVAPLGAAAAPWQNCNSISRAVSPANTNLAGKMFGAYCVLPGTAPTIVLVATVANASAYEVTIEAFSISSAGAAALLSSVTTAANGTGPTAIYLTGISSTQAYLEIQSAANGYATVTWSGSALSVSAWATANSNLNQSFSNNPQGVLCGVQSFADVHGTASGAILARNRANPASSSWSTAETITGGVALKATCSHDYFGSDAAENAYVLVIADGAQPGAAADAATATLWRCGDKPAHDVDSIDFGIACNAAPGFGCWAWNSTLGAVQFVDTTGSTNTGLVSISAAYTVSYGIQAPGRITTGVFGQPWYGFRPYSAPQSGVANSAIGYALTKLGANSFQWNQVVYDPTLAANPGLFAGAVTIAFGFGQTVDTTTGFKYLGFLNLAADIFVAIGLTSANGATANATIVEAFQLS